MSSTLRKQQIEELKNYNQNINRQALAKTYSQVALWELERPEMTSQSGEFTAKTDVNTETLITLLNEKLSSADRMITRGRPNTKDIDILTKITDTVADYNKLIEPLLQGRSDSRIKSVAKSSLIKLTQPVVGLKMALKDNILQDIQTYGVENVRAYVNAYILYDYIEYQINTEDYKRITKVELESRASSSLRELPEEVQGLYRVSKERFEAKFGGVPLSRFTAESNLTPEEQEERSSRLSNISLTQLREFKQVLRNILATGTNIDALNNNQLRILKNAYDSATPRSRKEETVRRVYDRLVEEGPLPGDTPIDPTRQAEPRRRRPITAAQVAEAQRRDRGFRQDEEREEATPVPQRNWYDFFDG